MPDGVALVTSEMNITWANGCMRTWSTLSEVVGQNFYASLGNPEIMGPDFCPFHTALATGNPSSSTLQTADFKFYQVHVAPLPGAASDQAALVATVSDITAEILQQQKLAAIHQAGQKLTDLKPDEIFAMDTTARIDLLKDNIRHYTQDLLNVEVIEIRLLEQSTSNLIPLLSVASIKKLLIESCFARPAGNGVTGYVASTGQSYLCHDASQDPLYLEGFKGARSSLTVPILLHEQVIGTINVESPTHLRIQCQRYAVPRDLCPRRGRRAEHTRTAGGTKEQYGSAKLRSDPQRSRPTHRSYSARRCQRDREVHRTRTGSCPASATHRPECARHQTRHPADRSAMAPVEAVPVGCTQQQHAKLRGKRILVVDADPSVRNNAHNLLEKYGCIVETASSGDEAVLLFRNSGLDVSYDVVISDIKLPDYSGYQLMLRLQAIQEQVPMILMTGYGYDPGHSIVKARQAGLHPKGLLYKPFRLTQLINVVETIIDCYQPQVA